MDEDQLEALERDLATVSDDLAARRGPDALAAARRVARRPLESLVAKAALLAGMAALGVWLDRAGMWVTALLIAFLYLPGWVRVARDRRRMIGTDLIDLFSESERELRRKQQTQLVSLLSAVPCAIALTVLSVALDDPLLPIIGAVFLFGYAPYLWFFGVRRTAGELREVQQWRRELDPESFDGESDGESDREDVEEEDDDESAWSIYAHLLLRSVQASLLYLGPPVVVLLGFMALLGFSSRRSLITAAIVAVLWALQWKFWLPEEGDGA